MSNKLLHNLRVEAILKEEFINEIRIAQNALAKAISLPSNRIHVIFNGTRRVTADNDLRLCRFCLSEGYFM